jgi:NRPS condensation-like uncharacterized protein
MLSAELSDVGLFGSLDRYGDLGMHIVLDLRRAFSREELTGAMEAAIRAFPVLGRRYVTGFWRDHWQKATGPVSDAVHVIDEPEDLEAETAAWARRPIDSTRERPLRLVSLRREGGSRLIMSITHLAVDGAGAAAVGHVLGAHLYGQPPSAPVDARRNVRSVLDGLRWFHVPGLVRDAASTVMVPLRTFRAARRDRQFTRSPGRLASWRHLTISAAEVARIKARCKPVGASVNDALIAALARVSAGRSSVGPLAILYTMDLRRYAGSPRLSAANTSSILSVVLPREAIADLSATAGAVARITQKQHRGLAGPAFILTPIALSLGAPHAWVRRFVRLMHPVLIDMPLRRGMIFTNVGRIDDGLTAFGDDIEDVRIIGPNIVGVKVPAVVAFGYRGALQLELFGPPGLGAEALLELETELLAALEVTA